MVAKMAPQLAEIGYEIVSATCTKALKKIRKSQKKSSLLYEQCCQLSTLNCQLFQQIMPDLWHERHKILLAKPNFFAFFVLFSTCSCTYVQKFFGAMKFGNTERYT